MFLQFTVVLLHPVIFVTDRMPPSCLVHVLGCLLDIEDTSIRRRSTAHRYGVVNCNHLGQDIQDRLENVSMS